MLRTELPGDSSDDEVFNFPRESESILIACNRDDFLRIASASPHYGLVIVVRRRTRGQEKAALLRLMERAGEIGLRHNINFA